MVQLNNFFSDSMDAAISDWIIDKKIKIYLDDRNDQESCYCVL